MIVSCPLKEDRRIKFLVCLYLCPLNTKVQCSCYKKNYNELKNMEIDQKYLDKYGKPEYPLPSKESKIIKKRKRRTKKEMEEARKRQENL